MVRTRTEIVGCWSGSRETYDEKEGLINVVNVIFELGNILLDMSLYILNRDNRNYGNSIL